ncbi:uncharacterized protein [Rutidosis leptorrhynchoides]|uniref:uncharacterized protein n=1 Tax=Rutidosis leptorrhynchoides TaxID=125765 RepID=UPI003A98D953
MQRMFKYYKCPKEDECSEFVLHVWCTQLSTELKSYPDHSEHTLHLISNVPNNVCGVFECSLCRFLCNGFAYGCHECKYYIDIKCAYMPEKIEHEAHPDHLLSGEYVISEHDFGRCGACLASTTGFRYTCRDCDFKLHHQCALYLVKTITHTYDKHYSLRLTYSPIENRNSDYFL